MPPYISFITTIKICKGYEWLLDRINIYILCIEKFCTKYDIAYEIVISEQVNEKNVFLVKDKLLSYKNVRVLQLDQTYPNPFGHNLIEAYGKNQCLKEATGKYCCMTSADQIFSEDFFVYIKKEIKPRTFYRFATFSMNELDVSAIYNDVSKFDNLMAEIPQHITHLCNTRCFGETVTPIQLGQKSGDIMLLDTESFTFIKGWPETICFNHMDTATCMVACNNFPFVVAPKNVCTYTMTQPNRNIGIEKQVKIDKYTTISVEQFEWAICRDYQYKTSSN